MLNSLESSCSDVLCTVQVKQYDPQFVLPCLKCNNYKQWKLEVTSNLRIYMYMYWNLVDIDHMYIM